MTPMRDRILLAAPLAALLLAGCAGGGPTAPDGGDDAPEPPTGDETVLLSVAPEGGSSGVGVDTVITVEFSHPMDPDMSAYADVHEGELAGPEVTGAWEWLEGGTVLRFTPDGPLQPATDYLVHLGAGMTDAEGRRVDMAEHGPGMGGRWATDGMMGGGPGGMGPGGTGPGGMGPGGGMDPSDHMGAGWDHPDNGSHGMVFVFTTAG